VQPSSSTLYTDCESIRAALNAGMLDWDVRHDPDIAASVRIAFQRGGEVRAMSLCGEPARAIRGRSQLARDDGAFLGVLFQRRGRSVCEQAGGQTVADPGDVVIWHSERPIDFIMPERFLKLCMLIPVERFEAVLPNARAYEGMHLRAGTNTASLLGACLATLADDVFPTEDEPIDSAMDVVLEILAAGMNAAGRPLEPGRRSSLFERIAASIEPRLGDRQLTPATIAGAHGISVRYLHLLFSQRGTTVGGWIRSRRLARCRAELARHARDRSITEIAFNYGFSDSAHFSRCFKTAFGVSPGAFRRLKATARLP
jgi:AraC-like DNA-binding protein